MNKKEQKALEEWESKRLIVTDQNVQFVSLDDDGRNPKTITFPNLLIRDVIYQAYQFGLKIGKKEKRDSY